MVVAITSKTTTKTSNVIRVRSVIGATSVGTEEVNRAEAVDSVTDDTDQCPEGNLDGMRRSVFSFDRVTAERHIRFWLA
jgi:hypothetical protein